MKTLKKFENFVNERKTTDEEKEVFLYLNDLRDSGVVNMFGATPYISDEFGLGKRESQKLLSLWMKNYNNDGDYDEINEKKNYTEAERKKDYRRIEDIVEKGYARAEKKNTDPDYEMMKLATTQANRIKDSEKAYHRAEAAEDDNYHQIAEIFYKRAKELNESKNESYSFGDGVEYKQDVGGISLIINGGSPTTWYYIQDAIQNGLLEETLGIDDDIINDYADDKGIDYLDMTELIDMLMYDFEEELGNLLEYLIRIDYLDQDITSVSIEGEDEDGEYHELDYLSE